jgi:hypothetical protein
MGLQPLQLAFQPGAVALDELPGHRHRAAAGNGNPGGAIGMQSEPVTAGARMAHHQERHGLFTDLQMNQGKG